MKFIYNPYIWPLCLSALVSLALGIFALLRRRNTKGVMSFILSMFVVTLWSLGNALEMLAVDLPTKLFFANLQYLAYCYSPVTLLALCMQFTGYDAWVRSRRILALAVLPTLIVLLVWTDSLHGLIRFDLHMDTTGAFPVIAKKYGPGFFVHAAYSHMLNIIAGILLIRAVFFKNTVYRKQAIALIFGMSLIVAPNILYIIGMSPIDKFDITPVFFGPAGLIIAWGIFRYKMFDMIPIARATVLETVNAGVLVLDLQNRVLDINPAIKKMLGITDSRNPGMDMKNVYHTLPELERALMDESITQTEFTIKMNDRAAYYEAILSPLTDQKGNRIGKLVVIYDITERKESRLAHLKQQQRLAVIEERERMARDLHDNLGQILGFINLHAQGIRQELVNAGVETAVTKLERLVDVTQSAHNEIRKYIRHARNASVLEQNLLHEMMTTMRNFIAQTGIALEHNLPDSLQGNELGPEVQINTLNIFKEALNNVRKHSEANKVSISFSMADEHLFLSVSDNGRGFDLSGSNRAVREGLGLKIMGERAQEIGGKLIIESEAGKGSRIALRVPLASGGKHL